MESKKLLAIIKILVSSVILIIAAYGFFTLLSGGSIPFNLSSDKEPNIVLQDIVLDDAISAIDLKWYSGGVKIIKSKDDRIHITEKATKHIDQDKLVKPTIENETLVLHSRNRFNFFCFFNNSSRTYLELQVPDQSYKSLKAVYTSGQYKVSDFNINKVDINMTSGDLSLSNILSDSTNITMTSGEAQFVNVKTMNLDLEMTSGSFDYQGSVEKFTNIEMTSGNLTFDLSASPTEDFDLEMTSGRANITFSEARGFQIAVDRTSGNFNVDPRLSQITDNLYEYLDSKLTYQFEMTSGDVFINLK